VFAYSKLLKVLPGLPRIALSGPWYRVVKFEHLKGPPPPAKKGPVRPLWPGGAPSEGARFTRKSTATSGIKSLYLATDVMTAVEEVTQVLRPAGSPVPLIFVPYVLLTVQGVLTSLVEVSDVAIQAKLHTNHAELTGDWQTMQVDYLAGKGPLPPTQVLGQAAFDAGGIVGLVYKSAKSSTKVDALLIFRDRLASAGCYVELFNKPGGKLQQRLP
jgi:hypothetical protein